MDKANNDGLTPLIQDAHGNHEVVVDALQAAGAEVNKANNDGDTPLICAATVGHEVVMKALQAARARVDKMEIVSGSQHSLPKQGSTSFCGLCILSFEKCFGCVNTTANK